MQYKDLQTIKDWAARNFTTQSLPVHIEGKPSSLTDGEITAFAYYNAVVDFLVGRGYLQQNSEVEFQVIEPDSLPMEDDYT